MIRLQLRQWSNVARVQVLHQPVRGPSRTEIVPYGISLGTSFSFQHREARLLWMREPSELRESDSQPSNLEKYSNFLMSFQDVWFQLGAHRGCSPTTLAVGHLRKVLLGHLDVNDSRNAQEEHLARQPSDGSLLRLTWRQRRLCPRTLLRRPAVPPPHGRPVG